MSSSSTKYFPNTFSPRKFRHRFATRTLNQTLLLVQKRSAFLRLFRRSLTCTLHVHRLSCAFLVHHCSRLGLATGKWVLLNFWQSSLLTTSWQCNAFFFFLLHSLSTSNLHFSCQPSSHLFSYTLHVYILVLQLTPNKLSFKKTKKIQMNTTLN